MIYFVIRKSKRKCKNYRKISNESKDPTGRVYERIELIFESYSGY